jgi:hypothetical protein
MSKNIITLYNNIYKTHKMSIINSHEIFKRDDMINSIQAIENKEYTYDDIVSINVVNLLQVNIIDDLPHNLTELIIKHTTLNSLVIPRECLNLQKIDIRESNLTSMPEIYFLPKLKVLHLECAGITHIQDRYPPSLESINLTGNCLNKQNTDLTKFPKNIPIILFKNGLHQKPKLEGHNISYGTQYSVVVHKEISNYSIQRDEALDMLRNAVNIRRIDQMMQPTQTNMFNSSQTVHISSICNSVTKSLYKINELTNSIYNSSFEDVLIDELINEFYIWKPKTFLQKVCSLFTNHFNDSLMIGNIRRWVEISDVNTKTHMTYGELLAKVWILIKNHPQKQDFIDNVKIELHSSIGVCFTGRFNRLVNSLIGFVDGITVGITIQEQLQMEISKLIAKLGSNEITYKECYKKITELFEDPDVKEDETITSYYMQSWLDALDDYKPDEDEDERENENENENVDVKECA